jgi:hypothetical protein
MDLDKTILEITKQIHYIIENTENFEAKDYKNYTRDGFMTWSKTDKGLILKYSYGSINSLITPYGELRLLGSCMSYKNGLKNLHNKIINKFDLEIYKDIVENQFGSFGPWYKFKSFNINLDEPKLIGLNNDLNYYECKKKYKELFKDY